MRRPDGSTTCAKGNHPWVEENIYRDPDGKNQCRACRRERQAKPANERHTRGSNHCHRGHEYTPENTLKRAKMVNGKKVVSRTCIACKKSQGYYNTSANK